MLFVLLIALNLFLLNSIDIGFTEIENVFILE